MRHRILLLAALLPLAACTDQQTASLQQAASAAIGSAHQGIEQASAPLGKLKQQASAALGVATVLNPELKQQVQQLKEQASALKGAVEQQTGQR
ncbi:hypothetical protein [Chromobacterium sp. IIBBL 290-4]|uniref:hypothetical protein n=1 Tax=Chromobacterium sp. IIBBL 290-4 TaxID=2953890 RepID=UPI0020B821A1|nr:hypothetical protein [Chromobacterium sp. IIBBL 290-4]UTH75914.1 hypothetical protein NKT35_07365 [Chromobacterium sp. IIBBL 290-4]